MTPSGSLTSLLEPLAALGGVLAFLLEALAVLVLFRAMSAFRTEVRKVDALVAEYVRCRDYLLATRRPSEEIGWRTVDGGAFREAWGNFNRQLETIRARYHRTMRPLAITLWIVLPLLLLVLAGWIAGLPAGGSWMNLLTPAGAALSALLLWWATFATLRSQRRLIFFRTDGNYLIAPWPTDGGTAEKQIQLMEKFLPVESLRTESETAEAL